MPNQILKILQSAISAETTNDYQITPHAITVNLPDQSQIIIGIILTKPSTHIRSKYHLRTKAQHTYHFLHQNDATAQTTLKPFTLQSLEDCRSYVEDVCRTFINAQFRDYEISFPNGSAYLVVIAPAKNHHN